MAMARQKVEWERTAALMAKIHNVNCVKRGDLIRDPSILNPYAERRAPRRRGVTVGELGNFLADESAAIRPG